MPNLSRMTQLRLKPMETDGGSSLGLTSPFFKRGCDSTVRIAQPRLEMPFLTFLSPILHSLWDIYLLTQRLPKAGTRCPGHSASQLKHRQLTPLLEQESPVCQYKSQNRLQYLLGRAFLFLFT